MLTDRASISRVFDFSIFILGGKSSNYVAVNTQYKISKILKCKEFIYFGNEVKVMSSHLDCLICSHSVNQSYAILRVEIHVWVVCTQAVFSKKT